LPFWKARFILSSTAYTFLAFYGSSEENFAATGTIDGDAVDTSLSCRQDVCEQASDKQVFANGNFFAVTYLMAAKKDAGLALQDFKDEFGVADMRRAQLDDRAECTRSL
jgi:hypothetical protein